MFETYLLASGASDFSPERHRAMLVHCLGAEGQHIFDMLAAAASGTVTAGKTDTAMATMPNEYDKATAALKHQFSSTSNVVM